MNLDIMKERYESLPVVELRAVAKARGMKGISALRKEDLIIRMLEEDKKDANREEQEKPENAAAQSGAEERQDKTQEDNREKQETKRNAKRKVKRAETKLIAEAETKTESALKESFSDKTVQEYAAKEEVPERTVQENAEKEGTSEKTVQEKQKRGGRTRNGRKRASETVAPEGDTGNPEAGSEQSASAAPAEKPAVRKNENGKARRGSWQKENAENRRNENPRAAHREEPRNERRYGQNEEDAEPDFKKDIRALDSGNEASGILEVMADGYGFIRSDNFLPGEDDVYVSPSQIRKFGLKTGDIVCGNTRNKSQTEKFSALLFVKSINGMPPSMNIHRRNFEDMTPIFPNERIHLERPGGSTAMRIVDLVSPIGKGQRGMIVSPPKAGKTTLLKDAAKSILQNNPEMHIIILLIDERPEEVTDMKETVKGPNVEVIYSTFDELPEHHKRVSEMVIERAKRLVELGQDVIIFIDSITRLARAYNQVVPPSGRTLSGGLDPAALHMPKRFFGAARNIREGGSLTILATALVETGSKMDDVVYEEFKGTGNMELILDRKLQERRVFPAIDLARSGTRREDLLLSPDEIAAVTQMRRALNGMKADEAGETIINLFAHTRTNAELVQMIRRQRIF